MQRPVDANRIVLSKYISWGRSLSLRWCEGVTSMARLCCAQDRLRSVYRIAMKLMVVHINPLDMVLASALLNVCFRVKFVGLSDCVTPMSWKSQPLPHQVSRKCFQLSSEVSVSVLP